MADLAQCRKHNVSRSEMSVIINQTMILHRLSFWLSSANLKIDRVIYRPTKFHEAWHRHSRIFNIVILWPWTMLEHKNVYGLYIFFWKTELSILWKIQWKQFVKHQLKQNWLKIMQQSISLQPFCMLWCLVILLRVTHHEDFLVYLSEYYIHFWWQQLLWNQYFQLQITISQSIKVHGIPCFH